MKRMVALQQSGELYNVNIHVVQNLRYINSRIGMAPM